MNKVYLIGPLLGVAIFGVAYGGHRRDFEARMTAHRHAREADRVREIREESARREAAHTAALAAREARTRARAEEEQKLADEKAALAAAQDERDQAVRAEETAGRQLAQLNADLERSRSSIARLEAETKRLQSEHAYLENWIREAETNRRALFALLEEMEANERALAEPPTAAASPRKPGARTRPKAESP